jgi:hypothetical protein|tara:strand:+ start:156 stop:1160 length:1005 start_codon:yes stop_codon:yes gene_type:complete
MKNILTRPMFRKGGLSQRQNYNAGGLTQIQNHGRMGFADGPEDPKGPTKAEVLEKYNMLRQVLPQQKDTRFLRYLSRAGNQLGQKRQPGTTALQRIINAASGDPLEKLYAETDERSAYDQGLQSLALEQTLKDLERKRNLFDSENARKNKMDDELKVYRDKLEIEDEFSTSSDNTPTDIQIRTYVEEDMRKRGLEPYDEDGRPSKDFQRELKFTKQGVYAKEDSEIKFPLSQVAGGKREMEASIKINQMQRIKEDNARRAQSAGIDLSTVEFHEFGQDLLNYVLYIGEEGIEIADANGKPMIVPGSAYVMRVGDEVIYYDINFKEIDVPTVDAQ